MAADPTSSTEVVIGGSAMIRRCPSMSPVSLGSTRSLVRFLASLTARWISWRRVFCFTESFSRETSSRLKERANSGWWASSLTSAAYSTTHERADAAHAFSL